MKEIYFYLPASLTAHYRRTSYPITFERPSASARTASPSVAPQTLPPAAPNGALSPFAMELATGVADGFVWLLKTLSFHRYQRLDERTEPVVPATIPETPAQRRIQRLLSEVPENLAAQARPGAASTR